MDKVGQMNSEIASIETRIFSLHLQSQSGWLAEVAIEMNFKKQSCSRALYGARTVEPELSSGNNVCRD